MYVHPGIRKGGKTCLPAVANIDVGEERNVLDGRVSLVTGSGRGIGQAIATGLARLGARVAVVARSTGEVEQTVRLISDRGGTALAAPADVARPDQVADLLRVVEDRWGSVEVLINNAAVVWPLGPSAELDPVSWERALAVNVIAPARLTFAVLPGMLSAGWGRIVNVSSGIASRPAGMLRANAYVTSKAALEAHTVNLAAELVGTGITVNAYRPGSVDTEMQRWIRDQAPQRIGRELHDRFVQAFEGGLLLTPEQSASSLFAHLPGTETGQTWSAAR